MQETSAVRRLSQIYLWAFFLIPALIFGFTQGRSNLYLIGGIANGVLMLFTAWALGAKQYRVGTAETRWSVAAGMLLVGSMIPVSMFAGLGPPPPGGEAWLATAWEQKYRYTLLIITGLLVAGGFAVLRERLREAGERYYSGIGYAAIMISTVLYIGYIASIMSFTPEAVRQRVASGTRPGWLDPLWNRNDLIGLIEVCLTYLSTAAFAAALRNVGWIGKAVARVFIVISLAAIPLVALSPLYTTTFGLPIFPLAIPAVPFTIPYYMGIALIRQAGDQASAPNH